MLLKNVFRLFIKLFLWVIASMVFLFIVIAIGIQLPSVQTFVVNKLTHSISDKTHTHVTIGHVAITFPKSIVLENIFFDDVKSDTLLFAKTIRADISMTELL